MLRCAFTPRNGSAPALQNALWLAVLLGSLSPRAAHADQSLTLELPPSREAQAMRAQEKAATRTPSARTSTTPRSGDAGLRSQGRYHPERGALSSRGQANSERVVGRLGQIDHATPIHRTRSARGAQLTVAGAGTYIAIEDEQGDWYGVLMADGSTGWIHRSNVRMLDYQVVSNGQLPTQAAGAQWGNANGVPEGIGSADIYPRSDRPYFTGSPQAFLNEAYKYLGVPYVWGGNTYGGIDCSGFVKNVYGALGFPLPRLGSDQMAYGVPVPVDQLQPGDRLYFTPRTERVGVHHTGFYVGNGYFIHASSGKHEVTVSHLSESYYRKNFVCARR